MVIAGKSVLRWTAGVAVLLLVLSMTFVRPANALAAALFRPFLLATGITQSEVATFFAGLLQGHRMRAERRELQSDVNALNVALAQSLEARAENAELRVALSLPDPAHWRRVVAPVIARDPAQWNRGFRIGKGEEHGVRVGSVVLQGTHVIGRVLEAARTSAYVATLADPACRLSVRVGGTDAVGVLGGVERLKSARVPLCLAIYLPRDEAYRRGNVVKTTALGGEIPGGVTIGRIVPWSETEVVDIQDNLYARALIEPFADFGHIHFVTVFCKQ